MQTFKVIALLTLLALVAVFTFQNTEIVNVNFLFWSVSMSSSLMLLAVLFLGIVIGWFLSFFNVKKKNRKKNEKNQTDNI